MKNIKQWSEIKNKYKNTLLLGNGASIAINSKFSYSNLFQTLINSEGDDKKLFKKLFKAFNSKDFEYILSRLAITSKVNHLLEIEENLTQKNYTKLRDSFINCVKENHPDYAEINNYLPKIHSFITRFKTVISLNYDLIAYYALLMGSDSNTNNNKRCIKDCFIDGKFNHDISWKECRKLTNKQKKEGFIDTTLLFYPHGSLILERTFDGTEQKIHLNDSEYKGKYLDQISQHWIEKYTTPIFVSEGTKEDKLNAIARSSYLNTIFYEVLPEKRKNIVIYGWSMGKNDDHILEALAKSKPTEIAVSAYNLNENECNQIENKLRSKFSELRTLDFFENNSSGCWCY